MSAGMITFPSREEWLTARNIVGGSDAACIVGMNPWKSNVELWLEKTGQCKPDDISSNPYVSFGTKAEAPLRELFGLNYPHLLVEYTPNNLWVNERYPWAHCSLDGWLTDTKTGDKGVLEVKTTNVMSSRQKEEWKDQIPMNYFCQVIHSMAVAEMDFAYVEALLRWEIDHDIYCQLRHYRIDRKDVETDIEILMEAEKKFAEDVKKRHKPALILPSI